RIIAEVQALELRAERAGCSLGLAVADLLDVLDGLWVGGILILPQLAGLAALSVGQGDHLCIAAIARGDRDSAAGTPHEVRRVGPDHEHPSHLPATLRVFSTAITCTSSSSSPASSSRSTISPIPSSTSGLKIWPRSVDRTECSDPAARMLSIHSSQVI